MVAVGTGVGAVLGEFVEVLVVAVEERLCSLLDPGVGGGVAGCVAGGFVEAVLVIVVTVAAGAAAARAGGRGWVQAWQRFRALSVGVLM
jgi:hypothetical protein